MTPLPSAEAEILVPFHDCDPIGIVWHGNYARYFEIARCALLDRIDYSYRQMLESGYAWPIIDMHLRYVRPARFDQRIIASATLEEWEHRLKIAYVIRDAASGERLVVGHTMQVAVTMPDFEMQYASPRILAEKLGIKTS